MTFYHFVNCVALTFAPVFIVKKGLAANFSYQQNLYVLVAYLVTQFLKLLCEGSLVSTEHSYTFGSELIKAFIGLLDFAALWFLLSKRLNRVSVGLSWTIIDSLVRRLAPLFKDARGEEFSFDNLHMALDANIYLVYFLSVAILLSIVARPGPSSSAPAQILLVAAALLQPVRAYFIAHFSEFLGNSAVVSIFVAAAYVGALAVLTNSLSKQATLEKNK